MANMSEEQLLEIYSDFYKYYSHEEFIEMMIDYEQRNQNQENLIKYLEKEQLENDIKANGMPASDDRDELIERARTYRDLLERIKNNNYEN